MTGARWLILVSAALGPGVVGCAGPRKSAPRVDPDTLSDEAFQAFLVEIDLVSVEEAYRAMLILADGEDTSTDFEGRRRKLEERGIAKAAWNLRSDQVVDAGSVAYMVCRICRITGGVNMNLLGGLGVGDRRYALRELVYRRMMEQTVDYEYLTGATLFALMRKADTLMEDKGLYESQGVDLTDETDRDAEGNLIVPPPVGDREKAGS